MNPAANESIFQSIATRRHEFKDPESKLNLADLFREGHVRYLNEHSLYLYYFKTIPNTIEQDTIDCEKANLWFLDNFDGYIKDWFYTKRCLGDGSDPIFDTIFYTFAETWLRGIYQFSDDLGGYL